MTTLPITGASVAVFDSTGRFVTSGGTNRAGSFVQLHFSLGGFEGFDVFAAGFPQSQRINCSTKAPIGAPQAIGSPSGLLFNPFNGRYTYIWKTQNSWRNTCREFQATFDDGTTKTAMFRFR